MVPALVADTIPIPYAEESFPDGLDGSEISFGTPDLVEFSESELPQQPENKEELLVQLTSDLPQERAEDIASVEELLDFDAESPEVIDDLTSGGRPQVEVVVELGVDDAGLHEVGFGDVELGEGFGASIPGNVPLALADELREFDFYLRNDMVDTARGVLDDLAPRYRGHPEVSRRLAELDSR